MPTILQSLITVGLKDEYDVVLALKEAYLVRSRETERKMDTEIWATERGSDRNSHRQKVSKMSRVGSPDL